MRRSVSMRSYVVYVYVGVWEGASTVISSLAAIVSNVLRWRGWNEVGFFACVVSTLESLLFACMFLVYNLSSRKQSNEHSRQSVCYNYIPITWRINQTHLWALCVYMWERERECVRVRERQSERVSEWVLHQSCTRATPNFTMLHTVCLLAMDIKTMHCATW